MFHVDSSWEKTSGNDIVRRILGQPGLLRFSMVELPVNTRTFHVDVHFKEGIRAAELFWQRYLCSDLISAVNLLNEFSYLTTRLSCQSQHSDDKPYQIEIVNEVIRVGQLNGTISYHCILANGDIIRDNFSSSSNKEDVTAETIWSYCGR
jgi:hypothetical protein